MKRISKRLLFLMTALATAQGALAATTPEAAQAKASTNPSATTQTLQTTPSKAELQPVDPAPYRTGFTSLQTELKYKKLPVNGVIPSWLHGALMISGPGKYEINTSQARTWLDGFAMVHKFSFKDGGVSYANKF